MTDACKMSARLQECFALIASKRMQGIPILNPAIEVQVVGMRNWNDYWLGILITPWFMNIMLLPASQAAKSAGVGTKSSIRLPAGMFEFIEGHEPDLGTFYQCSLFSPMFEFADHETAEQTAIAALDELMQPVGEASESEREMAAIWKGELPLAERPEESAHDQSEDQSKHDDRPLSRRAFLSGAQRTGEQSA